jgi:hypothetical protein
MFNTIVGAGAVGAVSRYGSGSDQKMRLLAAPEHWLAETFRLFQGLLLDRVLTKRKQKYLIQKLKAVELFSYLYRPQETNFIKVKHFSKLPLSKSRVSNTNKL